MTGKTANSKGRPTRKSSAAPFKKLVADQRKRDINHSREHNYGPAHAGSMKPRRG